MKPINCRHCGYLEEVTLNGKIVRFCFKSQRIVDILDKKDEECPLDKRPRDNADKKGFYLMEG